MIFFCRFPDSSDVLLSYPAFLRFFEGFQQSKVGSSGLNDRSLVFVMLAFSWVRLEGRFSTILTGRSTATY